MIAEGQHLPATTSQPNHGEELSLVGEQGTIRQWPVRELLESSTFKEARDRLIAERRRNLGVDSLSSPGEELPTVSEKEANDDGDEGCRKVGTCILLYIVQHASFEARLLERAESEAKDSRDGPPQYR